MFKFIMTSNIVHALQCYTVRVKVPINKLKNPEGVKVYPYSFVTSEVEGGRWSAPHPGRFTHCTGGWVDPRAGLDVCEKSRPYWDFLNLIFSSVWTSLLTKHHMVLVLLAFPQFPYILNK
jgi:hypothetical protein